MAHNFLYIAKKIVQYYVLYVCCVALRFVVYLYDDDNDVEWVSVAVILSCIENCLVYSLVNGRNECLLTNSICAKWLIRAHNLFAGILDGIDFIFGGSSFYFSLFSHYVFSLLFKCFFEEKNIEENIVCITKMRIYSICECLWYLSVFALREILENGCHLVIYVW